MPGLKFKSRRSGHSLAADRVSYGSLTVYRYGIDVESAP